jgi:hypothetical protein
MQLMIIPMDTIIDVKNIFYIFRIVDYYTKLLRQMERTDQAYLKEVNKNQNEYDPYQGVKSNSKCK